MDNVAVLLDKCKKAKSLRTDADLAAALGVTKQAVSGWRHGARMPDTVACGEIARISGEPLARVLGMVGEARAISQDEKRVWRRLASAAAIAVAALLPYSPPATASHGNGLNDAPNMHYVKWLIGSLCARGFFLVRQKWASVTLPGPFTAVKNHDHPTPMLAA